MRQFPSSLVLQEVLPKVLTKVSTNAAFSSQAEAVADIPTRGTESIIMAPLLTLRVRTVANRDPDAEPFFVGGLYPRFYQTYGG